MRAGRAGRAWQAGMLGARGRGAQGAQAAWALGRWAARARARGALERAAAGGASVRGRAGRAQQGRWALGARPGRLGWPWAVHSVHSAHFRSVLTRFFFLSQQMNTVHCKIKFFQNNNNNNNIY